MNTLPLAGFLDALRDRNFGIGLHEHMAVGKLLQHWEGTDRDELRNGLAALIARHDDEVREIRRAFDEFFPIAPPASVSGVEKPRTFQWVRIVRSRRAWLVALGVLAFVLLTALAIRNLLVTPLPPVPRPVFIPATELSPSAIGAPGPAFTSFVESLGEPPPVALPAAPRVRDWRGLGWLAAATMAVALTALWGVRLRAAARRWTAASWTSVLASLPGPFHGRLVLKDLVTRLPRADIEETATVLGRSFSREQRGHDLDVRQSLRETLRSGMLPRLIFRPRRVHETILVLEDTSQPMAVHSRRASELIRDLRRQGIALDQWWFDGDLGSPSRRPHGPPTPLESLCRGRDDGPVMILSTGHGMAATLAGPDVTWIAALRSRSRRVWINPITDPALWPTALARVPVAALPLTRAGLLSAARILTGDDRTIGEAAKPIGGPEVVTAAHVHRLERLASLVPYPTVELLELLRQRFAPDVPESAVLHTVDSRAAIANIPFRMTDAELRDRANQLRAEAPALEIQVRKYLLKVLADSEPAKGSAAHLRWQASAAIHRAQLAELEGTDARAAIDELHDLARGPLWEEIRGMVARQAPAGSATRTVRSAVQADRRPTDPPGFVDVAGRAPVRAFRWVAPGWRTIAAAAMLALFVVLASALTDLFRVQASHETDAYLLEYVPSELPGDPGYLMVRRRDAGAADAGRPRLYRGAAAMDLSFTVEGDARVRLPIDAGSAHIYQVRAPLRRGGLALSNTVWAPSVLVAIDAHPWARVTISAPGTDVTPFEQITPVTIRLPEGRYQLQLRNDGLTPERAETIDVSRTGPRAFTFEMPGLPAGEILQRLGIARPPAAAR